MLIGYECKHCGFRFKCEDLCNTCPRCGYWFDKRAGLPILVQNNEESFLNDPSIPLMKCVDNDPLTQKRQAIRKTQDQLNSIGDFFKR